MTVEPSKGSEVLAQINEQWPLLHLRHLKRIRKIPAGLQIIVDDQAEISEITGWLNDTGITFLSLQQVDVPADAPLSKEQHGRWCSVWPVSYHEPMTERMKPLEISQMQSIVDRIEEEIFDLSDSEALLVDRETGEIVLKASANPDHPLGHVCMEVIKQHESTSYLLMGMVLIKRSEPCLMCAMALVHSRVAAVCYVNPDPERGGLGGQVMLPRQPSINHRFPVYLLS